MRRALVVSRYYPFSARRVHAVYQRLGTLLQGLAAVADEVTALFLVPPEQHCAGEALLTREQQLRELWSVPLRLRLAPVVEAASPRSLWGRMGRGIFSFHGHPLAHPVDNAAAREAVRDALATRPDVVLAHRLSAMCVLLQLPRAVRRTPLFFDLDDIEHVAWTRRLLRDPAWPAERLLLLQTPALLLAERRAVRRATATFVCSEADRRYLRVLSNGGRVEVVPNSVHFPPAVTAEVTEPLVLFVGSMGSRPNAQAVDTLVREIWPRVHARCPQAHLAIIGAGAENTRSAAAPGPNVNFVGFVGDLGPWYRRARLVCCPIRHGSGTRVKIIEAAAYGKAIVSTPMGAEGLNLSEGREILLEATDGALAEACVALLTDPRRAHELGAAARALALRHYEREAIVARLSNMFG
ncbi:MAG: glycosyltransferase, partial [Gammaproteobacteria bacterium]|nr:glycosyltransferase [Gammaproteobacteria bacterium]